MDQQVNVRLWSRPPALWLVVLAGLLPTAILLYAAVLLLR